MKQRSPTELGSSSMMKRSFLIFIVLVMASSELWGQAKAVTSSTDGLRQILEKRVEVNKQAVGISVGLIEQGGSQFVAVGAMRAGDKSSKPDSKSVFEIGSVTKVFTGLLLADMVEHGEVSLSDPASKYLPKSVALPVRNGREITLLDLATHTSALPSMPDNFTPRDDLNPYADYSVEQLYAALSSCKLTRDIGKEYEYSNLGMGLLGHILALKAGRSYEDLVLERIAKPLGMKDTSIALSADMKKRLATGHNEALEVVKNWDIPTLAGAGALRSTTEDMVKFIRAYLNDSYPALAKPMALQLESRTAAGQPNLSIALGWHKLKTKKGELVWHNGQTGGYHSFVGFDKARGKGVVVLANSAADIDDIGLHLLDSDIPLRKIEPKKQRKEVDVDRAILEKYVGDYELVPTFVISITQEGNRLMLQATGQPKFPIYAESEKEFFLKVVDAQVSFVTDDKGNATRLILHQGGADQSAKKRR